MIIGRAKEIATLENVMKKPGARFLAIYGRRRVGKTFLIREFFSGRGVMFEVMGQKNASREKQLANFTSNYSSTYLDNAFIPRCRSWSEALDVLTKQLLQQDLSRKQVLFFDELPWLGDECLSALDYAWNAHWSKCKNVILIVCGSAASWMMRRVINAKGGLYNRLTELLHLQPFDLLETKAFLEHRNIRYPLFQQVELYLSTGGIPYYLDLLNRDLSVPQNIEQLMFGEHALLKGEYERLFDALFDDAANHHAIMNILAKSRTGVPRKKVQTTLKLADSTLHKVLTELEASAFIKRYVPFGYKKRGSFYRISDEYSLFYLKWIEPIKDKRISDGYWSNVQQGPSWASWAGYSFEWFCEKHYSYLLKTLGISGITSTVSKWRFEGDKQQGLPGAEIDLLIDRADQVINVCELKFTKKPWIVDNKYSKQLQERLAIFTSVSKTRKAVVPILISASGALENVHLQESFPQHFTLDDLFSPLGFPLPRE